MVKFLAIYVTFIYLIFYSLKIYSDNVQTDVKFFRYLRALDNLSKEKRKKAYLKLNNFLLNTPKAKYMKVLMKRTTRVSLEQKFLLQNLIEKFRNIFEYEGKLSTNNFIKKCPDFRLKALEYLSGVGGFYDKDSSVKNNYEEKILYSDGSYSYTNKYGDLYHYIGLFKKQEHFVYSVNETTYLRRSLFYKILNMYERYNVKQKMNINNDESILKLYDANPDDLANIFIYQKNKKQVKRIINWLLPFVCLRSGYIKDSYLYDFDIKLNQIEKLPQGKICKTFLELFGNVITFKSRNQLLDKYRSIIANIKTGVSGNSLQYLVILEQNLESIANYKLFPNALKYKDIVRNKIINKLKGIKNVCNKLSRTYKFYDSQNDSDITNYLKHIAEYNSIIKQIPKGCMYIYSDTTQKDSNLLFELAKKFIVGKRLNVMRNFNQGYAFDFCDGKFLKSLLCSVPTYALKFVYRCRDKKLKKSIMSILSNFNIYDKKCNEEAHHMYRYMNYYPLHYGSNAMKSYLDILTIMGKIKRNLPKIIIKYAYMNLKNINGNGEIRYDKYPSSNIHINDVSRFLNSIFTILGYLPETKRKSLIKKIFKNMLSTIIDNVEEITVVKVKPWLLNIENSNAIRDKYDKIYYYFANTKRLKQFELIMNDENVRESLIKFLQKNVMFGISMRLKRYLEKIYSHLSGYELLQLIKLMDIIEKEIQSDIGIKTKNNAKFKVNLSKLMVQMYGQQLNYLIKYKENQQKKGDSLKSYIKTKNRVAVFTLLYMTNNEKIRNRIINVSKKYFSGADFTTLNSRIVQRFVYFFANNSDVYSGVRDLIYQALVKSIFFRVELLKSMNRILKNICNTEVYSSTDFLLYIKSIINLVRYQESDTLYKKIVYRIVNLFPIVLSHVESYIPINNEIFFATLGRLIQGTVPHFADILKNYNLQFLNNTSNVVKNTYKKIMKLDAKTLNNLYFYMPVIVNTKTKKVIISDFSNINSKVISLLRSNAK